MALMIPGVVRRKAELAGAHQWLADLPGLIADLQREWRITVATPFADATEAYVAQAATDDGQPVVLKLLVPREANVAHHEIIVLDLAAGEGCVRMLRHDADRGALLLERVGRPLHALGLPLPRRLEILTDLAAKIWRPAPTSGLPTGADKGRWLEDFILSTWESLGRPCSQRAVDHALGCVTRRIGGHDDERARLVHGDVHQWNALESATGFVLVDPDGLLAEPEYDLGVIMREDPVDLLRDGPHARAHWLAARTGLDVTSIWEWGVVERLSTALLLTSIDVQPVGREMLHAAEVIAADHAQIR